MHWAMAIQAFVLFRRLLLLVALAVSLTATGFAHRMPSPQDQSLALALANGVLPADFCGEAPDGMPADPHCLACQIAGTADLPAPEAVRIDLDLAVLVRVVAPRESPVPLRRLDHAHASQGPPVV
jgi:hypothetical protein